MTTLDATLRPCPRVDWITGLLYPLSALCMMIGCYTLSQQMDMHIGSIGKLLTLIGVLNVYEALLVALGLYLTVRRGVLNDGRLLLGLEIVFLVDAAFLNAECFAASLTAGALINTALALLTALKIGAVIRYMRLTVTPSHLAWLGAAYLLTLAMPGISAARSASVPITPWFIYGGWWAAGLMLAGHAALAGRWHSRQSGWPTVSRPISLLFAAAVYVSFAGHIAALGWIYDVTFEFGVLSPLLLAMIMVVERLAPGWKELRAGQFWLAVLAVIFSGIFTQDLVRGAPTVLGVGLSPMRLTLLAAGVEFAIIAWRAGLWRFVVAGVVALSLGLTSTTFGGALEQWMKWLGWVGGKGGEVMPRGAIIWGTLLVLGAFVFLALGLMVSMRKEPESMEQERHSGDAATIPPIGESP